MLIALVLRRSPPQKINFIAGIVSESCGARFFLEVSMCKSGSETDYVYSPGWACDLHVLKSMSLVSYKQERKKVMVYTSQNTITFSIIRHYGRLGHYVALQKERKRKR